MGLRVLVCQNRTIGQSACKRKRMHDEYCRTANLAAMPGLLLNARARCSFVDIMPEKQESLLNCQNHTAAPPWRAQLP